MDLAQIAALGVDEDRVSQEVRGAVDRMLGARTQSLAAGNGGSGKLIVP
jgi:citrate lyase gamma subunit